MQILEDGKLHIESAFEASVASRMWTFGRSEEIGHLVLKHPGYNEPTTNEVEFYRREQAASQIILSEKQTRHIRIALATLVAKSISHEGVTSEQARKVLEVLQRNRLRKKN